MVPNFINIDDFGPTIEQTYVNIRITWNFTVTNKIPFNGKVDFVGLELDYDFVCGGDCLAVYAG